MVVGLVIVAVVVGLFFYSTVKVVPQGTLWLVERLGKFHKELGPGLNLVIPFIDVVAYRMSTKDTPIDIPTQEVITKDNAVVKINGLVFVRVVDAPKAAYGVQNYISGVVGLSGPILRNIIGGRDLDECLSSRDVMKTAFKEDLEYQMKDWGIQIRSVEIQDILPSDSMQHAMEQQAAAERDRKAMETRAEGEKQAAIRRAEGIKQSQILEAEARKEAARLDADAARETAKGTQDATRMIAEAVNSEAGKHALGYQLGRTYIQSIGDLAGSENAKSVFIPADLNRAVAPFATAGAGFEAGADKRQPS